MKKTLLTIAIILGMTLGAVAQKQGGGLFGMGDQRNSYSYDYEENQQYREGLLALPSSHGSNEDQSPLGTGALLLIGFGSAYALKKKQK